MLYRVALRSDKKIGMFRTGYYFKMINKLHNTNNPLYKIVMKASNDFAWNLKTPSLSSLNFCPTFFFTEKGYARFKHSILALKAGYKKIGIDIEVFMFNEVEGKVIMKDEYQVGIILKEDLK